MEPKGIFRNIPSKELVEEILITLHFLGFHDTKTFTKRDLPKDKFEEVLIWIEPYYVPCKAKRFLSDINENKQITVLRHLLRAHNYDLIAQEKVYNSVKVTTYKIYQKTLEKLNDVYIMEFN